MAGNETGQQPEMEQTGHAGSGHAGHTGNEHAGQPGSGQAGQRLKARELNELIRYTMWSVFRVSDSKELAGGSSAEAKIRDAIAIEVSDLLGQAEGKGIVTRGCYDIQGMRADADYMFWWVARSSDDLQEIYSRFRGTRLGRASEPAWSAMGVHRAGES